jgi:hypothetical protein
LFQVIGSDLCADNIPVLYCIFYGVDEFLFLGLNSERDKVGVPDLFGLNIDEAFGIAF